MRMIVVLIALIISACGPGGGGGGKSDSGNPPVPAPKPGPPPVWGELKCQQRSNCKDLALNLEEKKLLSFFFGLDDFIVQSNGLTDRAIFGCARILGQMWSQSVGKDEYHQGYDALLLKMIDFESCRSYGAIEKNLNQYFVSTEDYKNEVNVR